MNTLICFQRNRIEYHLLLLICSRTSQANPIVGDSKLQKVPPITLRKMASNGRLIAITKSPAANPAVMKASPVTSNGTVQQQHAGGPSGYLAVRQNLSSQTIDLTDEEEPKSAAKAYSVTNPPALTSITNKANPQQYAMTQQRLAQKPTPIGMAENRNHFANDNKTNNRYIHFILI